MRREVGREIAEKLFKQRFRRTETVVAQEFVKAGHDRGAEAKLDSRFAVDTRYESSR